jgi:ATP-binding cassette subfamily B protein IrtB
MLKNAPIILDEATANVAPENGKKLMDAIEAMTREKTVVTRARRLKTVRCADRILVLDGICRRFIAERRRAGGWKI